jgi:hypothetical protein
MRKFLLVLGIILIPYHATKAQESITRFFYAYNHETITVSTSAIGFTSSLINPGAGKPGANLAIVTVECASGTSCLNRFTLDGTTPTSSVGQQMDYEYILNVYGNANITKFQAIRSSSTNAVYQVVYYY